MIWPAACTIDVYDIGFTAPLIEEMRWHAIWVDLLCLDRRSALGSYALTPAQNGAILSYTGEDGTGITSE